ncbi:MAG: hypothetical protein R3Y38_05815 [Rikenellaceae bacterium]
MISLLIDDKEVDFDTSQSLALTLSVSSITNIDSSSAGYSKTIVLPKTLKNREILGDLDEINSITMFNQQQHTGRITVDGFVVIDGQVMLSSSTSSLGYGEYEIVIIGASKLWVSNAAQDMINEINISFSDTITSSMIKQSWSWDSPVRMLPVMRDEDFYENENKYAYVPIRILSARDYHPFLHLATLMRTIFESSGYSIASEFMDSDYFDSLYISGAYSTRDVDALKEKMDFLAGVFADKSATANHFGRVVADPSCLLSSFGNIVDTADPFEESEDGVRVSGVYNVDNCFYNKDGFVVFVPTSDVTISFELNINYLTEYYITSRGELLGFNEIYLDEYQGNSFKLTNSFVDKKASLFSGYDYMVIVFDYQQGDEYKLAYRVSSLNATSPDDYEQEIEYSLFSSRTEFLSLSTSMYVVCVVLYKKDESGNYVECEDDWAVYDASVGERGTVEVEVCVRSESENLSSGEIKYFHDIYFGGAEEGMTFTLLKETTLRPVFSPHPGLDSSITFVDVAQHEYRQIALLSSVRHLFDLCFYTDNQNKVVYIEPRRDFYNQDVIVDWSDKIDMSYGIKISELGDDLSSQITFAYQDGDGAVARWNESYKEKFAEWSADIANNFADDGEQIYYNTMFCPTIDLTGVLPNAADATFINVGDRDDDEISDDDLNFPCKIVRYMGMVDLPEGQSWGWPSSNAEYPCLGFHSGLHNIGSLCFDDRDNQVGLHEYYDGAVEIYNNSKRVELYLKLSPKDVEPLVVMNSLERDFRALYRLEIGGESALFYLEEICDYNPASSGSTKCIFIKKV